MIQATSAVAEDRQLIATRLFKASRAIVWAAFADPWQVSQWWGPKGFTTTITEMDLRAGGKWSLVMHGPDGTRYPNEMVFTGVVPMERVSLRLSGGRAGAEVVHFDKTLTFSDEDGGTRFTVTSTFETAEERDRNVREYGSVEGARQMFERLESHLSAKAAGVAENGTHELVITRVFHAPRELVWQAWTDIEMAKQWQAPRTFEVTHLEQDLRVGGQVRKCMRGKRPGAEQPVEIWLRGEVLEVRPPELLRYTYAWEDRTAVGLVDDGDPHETVVTVRLEEQDGKTTMHFHQAPFPTAAERDGHNGGWSSGFERLAELLETK